MAESIMNTKSRESKDISTMMMRTSYWGHLVNVQYITATHVSDIIFHLAMPSENA